MKFYSHIFLTIIIMIIIAITIIICFEVVFLVYCVRLKNNGRICEKFTPKL